MWRALSRLHTGEGSALLPLRGFPFVLLLHRLATEAVPVITSGPAAGKSFFVMQLTKVIYELQNRASSNAVLLVHVEKG